MKVTRTGIVLKPDASRVLFRPFAPAGDERPLRILSRVLALPEAEVVEMLAQVLAEFKNAPSKTARLLSHPLRIRSPAAADRPTAFPTTASFSSGPTSRTNTRLRRPRSSTPPIVPHPDQTGLPAGALRFILSLRATGEGHISSITFRTGTIDGQGKITVDTPSRYVTTPDHIPPISLQQGHFLASTPGNGLGRFDCRNDSKNAE